MGRLCSRFFPKKAGWRTFCLPIAIGTGTNFVEHYACCACPAFANQKRGYKFDRSREFIPGYKVSCGHWRSVAVQAVSEPEICQDAGFRLRADARVRVEQPLQICLECRSKS